MNARTFDGETYSSALDGPRLSSQFDRVLALMRDGTPRTLWQIQERCGGSEAAISARLRDLRKARFGGYRVNRIRRPNGLWVYQVLPPLPASGQLEMGF
jgi:hypothetical protein